LVRGRIEKFPSERITMMITEEVDTLIKIDLSKDIMKDAKNRTYKIASSYSKIINEIIAEELAKGTDKKILKDAKER